MGVSGSFFDTFELEYRIDEIEATTRTATPAPWFIVERGNSKRHVEMSSGRMLQDWHGSILKRDAEFVAVARKWMPKLIRKYKELDAQNAELALALSAVEREADNGKGLSADTIDMVRKALRIS